MQVKDLCRAQRFQNIYQSLQIFVLKNLLIHELNVIVRYFETSAKIKCKIFLVTQKKKKTHCVIRNP